METVETHSEPDGPSNLDEHYTRIFQQHTRALTLSLMGRDPRDGIERLELSIYHGTQSQGILADRPKWTIMWTLLLAYGLWRIEEMDEVAERLGDVKLLLDAFQTEIGSEAAARLLARANTLSRYPDVPYVDGISSGEPHFNWASHSVLASTYAPESDLDSDEGMVPEAQEGETADPKVPGIEFSLGTSQGAIPRSHDEFERDLKSLTLTATNVLGNSRIRGAGSSPACSTASALSSYGAQTSLRTSPRAATSVMSDYSSGSSQGAMSVDSPADPYSAHHTKRGFVCSGELGAGEELRVVGSPIELGAWDPTKGFVLASVVAEDIRSGTINLSSLGNDQTFEWKLVKFDAESQTVTSETAWKRTSFVKEVLYCGIWEK